MMPAGFEADALERRYSFLDECPASLLPLVVTLPLGSLDERVAGTRRWHDALLRGRLPEPGTWPGSPIDVPVRRALESMGRARRDAGGRHPERLHASARGPSVRGGLATARARGARASPSDRNGSRAGSPEEARASRGPAGRSHTRAALRPGRARGRNAQPRRGRRSRRDLERTRSRVGRDRRRLRRPRGDAGPRLGHVTRRPPRRRMVQPSAAAGARREAAAAPRDRARTGTAPRHGLRRFSRREAPRPGTSAGRGATRDPQPARARRDTRHRAKRRDRENAADRGVDARPPKAAARVARATCRTRAAHLPSRRRHGRAHVDRARGHDRD